MFSLHQNPTIKEGVSFEDAFNKFAVEKGIGWNRMCVIPFDTINLFISEIKNA